MEEKLRTWYGASINEYYDSGHELDVFAITNSGVKIYLEVIWHPSLSHVKSDLLILERSESDVKIVIANPEIIQSSSLVKEYNKSVMSLRKRGVKIWGVMLNGVRVLDDPIYVDIEIKQVIDSLLAELESFQEYNYEVDLYEILERDGIRERINKAPLVEILIGSTSQPSYWLQPSQLNLWIVSSIYRVRSVTPRRMYFECQSYGENIFTRVHTNGVFHHITPFEYDTKLNTYYIDYVFMQIIFFIVTSIRVLNIHGVTTEQFLELFFRNVAGVKMMYDPALRQRHWEYYFSDNEDELRFSYSFVPSSDWSTMTPLLLTIYTDICREVGSTITDEVILWRVKEIMKAIGYHAIQGTHSQFDTRIPGVGYPDFNFPK
jgi:hypothetical protein